MSFQINMQHFINILSGLHLQLEGSLNKTDTQGTHSHEMPQHIDQLPLFGPLGKNLMECVEFFGADLSVENNDRKIRPIRSWVLVIILVQVWLWPVNMKLFKHNRPNLQAF